MNNEKNKFKTETIEKLIFRYFNIRNFKIPKYWSFIVLHSVVTNFDPHPKQKKYVNVLLAN